MVMNLSPFKVPILFELSQRLGLTELHFFFLTSMLIANFIMDLELKCAAQTTKLFFPWQR